MPDEPVTPPAVPLTFKAPEGAPSTPPAPTPDAVPPAPAVETPEDIAADRDKWKHFAREHEKTAKANADAARKLAEIEEAAKTQEQKDKDAREAAEQRAAAAETELLRLRIATAEGLPPELAARLQGGTEDEMKADAEALKALLTPSSPPPGSADGGPRGAVPPGQLTRADLAGMTPDQIVEAKAKGLLNDLIGAK